MVWNKPEHHYLVPVWIIILAILAGLLLLALLIYLLYKVPGTALNRVSGSLTTLNRVCLGA